VRVGRQQRRWRLRRVAQVTDRATRGKGGGGMGMTDYICLHHSGFPFLSPTSDGAAHAHTIKNERDALFFLFFFLFLFLFFFFFF
jgi:hypothetical protein